MLCGLLAAAWQKAAEGANTLRGQLLLEQATISGLLAAGSVASVSKNSASQGYSQYGPGQITQVQLVEAYGNLIGSYDNTREKVVDAFCAADIDIPEDFDFDAPIYNLLTKALNAGDALVLPDITNLRLPRTLPALRGVAW